MGTKNNSHLSFLTWNLYLGVDLKPLMTFRPGQIPNRVTRIFRQFLATDFPSRAKAIAREIALKKPDVIGLQEVVRWQLVIPNQQTITYDFIQILLNRLIKCGLHYEIAAENLNVNTHLPDSYGNTIHLLDRDIILVRTQPRLKLMNKNTAPFKNLLSVPIARQWLEIRRGWSSVDLQMDGQIFRVINTHLEEIPPFQYEQAEEILAGPAKTKLPVIFLGDFNSSADGQDTPTYNIVLKNGFKDVWKEVRNDPGFTYGSNPDLLNAKSHFDQRLDYILFKNGWQATKAGLIGNKQKSRTDTGLWPSDHAGVFGELVLSK